jgi:hypothetical protein
VATPSPISPTGDVRAGSGNVRLQKGSPYAVKRFTSRRTGWPAIFLPVVAQAELSTP